MSFEITPWFMFVLMIGSLLTSFRLFAITPTDVARLWPYYIGIGVQIAFALAVFAPFVAIALGIEVRGLQDHIADFGPPLVFVTGFAGLAVYKICDSVADLMRDRAAKRVSAEVSQ